MNQFRLFLFAFLLSNIVFISCESSEIYEEYSIEETKLLSLKPDARQGKDAVIWTERPDQGSPNSNDFQAMGWTWYAFNYNGGIRRSLIEFDLSSIPENAQIVSATMNLYFNPTSAELPSTYGHSQRDGSNRSILSRITSSWNEETVNWNNQPSISSDNQIYVKASDEPDEDYQIDVKNLVEDMVKNPDESHGFMYKLENEDYYRAMIFASSDHDNQDLHPELIIEYKNR
ncbi:MAG: DNRLRE domain-containing protein [Saprospiraceae bacterium]|nr:DNRLRE domain-containing protein [Saprospiraceae bacterium]